MPTYNIIQRKNAINIVYYHNKPIKLPIGLKVDPKHFIKTKDRTKTADRFIRPSHPDYEQLNAIINDRLSSLRSYCNRYFMDKNHYPTPASLRGFFKHGGQAPQKSTFDKLWMDFIRHQTTRGYRPVSHGRAKHYLVALNHLKAYQPNITAEDLNSAFYNGFRRYLAATRSQSSIDVMVSVVKTFIKWAIANGHSRVPVTDISTYRVDTHHRDVIWHPATELQALLDVDLQPGSFLDHARDMYLLQCFLGVRHSDLTPSKWRIENGFIRKKAEKTDEEFTIPIRTEAAAILEKYSGSNPLPVMTNACYNRAIKLVGQRAQLNQPVTMVRGRKKFKPGQQIPKYKLMSSHVARATFICSMIQANLQTWKIMKMTGIKSEATIRYYADVLDTDLSSEIAQVEQRQGLRITHIAKTA